MGIITNKGIFILDADVAPTFDPTASYDGGVAYVAGTQIVYFHTVGTTWTRVEINNAYCPLPIVDTVSTDTLGTSSTVDINVKGIFLDQIYDASAVLVSGAGVLTINSVTVVSYEEININVTTDGNIGDYDLTILGTCGNITLPTISVLNITIVIPTTTGSAPELWVQNGAVNNDAVVGTGTFVAEGGNGDGWNEHAYFGTFTSASRIDFSMDVDVLNTTSNAYCYVRFTTSNVVGTTGNPRIYIQAGGTLIAYNSAGAATTVGTITVGDNIRVSLTPTNMEVFVNNSSVYNGAGAYTLTNIYTTFTGYRVFGASNIQVRIY